MMTAIAWVTFWWFDVSENLATTSLRAGKIIIFGIFCWVNFHMVEFSFNIMWKCGEW